MHIGIFTDTYKPDINGVVTSIMTKIDYLKSQGHKVTVIGPNSDKIDEKDIIQLPAVKFIFQPEYKISGIPTVSNIKKLRKKNFDVIHLETPFGIGILGLIVGKKYDIPIFHTYHTLFVEYWHYLKLPKKITTKLIKKLSLLFCNRCDYIFAPSKGIKKELEGYGIDKPIKVLPTGIKLQENNRKQEKIKGLKNKLGLKGKKILLYVGRLAKEKNIEFLLDLMAKLKNRKNIVLVLVGDGKYKNKLKEYIEKKNIDRKQVRFVGYIKRENIYNYYNLADIFVFSSMSETQGLVILEAMNAGLPIVALKAQGINDMIQSGQNGFLIEGDINKFKQKVLKLLESSKLKNKIGKKAKRQAKKFDTENIYSQYESICNQFIEKN